MITITQSPQDFYPAYNDSYLKFNTDFTEDDRAIIKISNTSYQFTIYPDASGEYLFNLKHLITTLINPNKFRDELNISSSDWGYADDNLYYSLGVEIITYGDNTTDTVTNTYSFNKAVKQFGDRSFDNPYQLMLPSSDGLNYNVKYWEGYPIDLPFRYLRTTDSIRLVNSNTSTQSQIFTIASDNPFRLFIDKGGVNWLTEEYFLIPDKLNKLQVEESGTVKSTIYLDKKNGKPGTYLKWLNAEGGYSYWLFNQWYTEEYNSSELDRVATNSFNNIYGNSQGDTTISGKEGAKSMKLKTSLELTDYEHLKSIITSPMVQMWSGHEPYDIGIWLGVNVNTKKLNYNNKKHINQVEIEIELPGVNTQTL